MDDGDREALRELRLRLVRVCRRLYRRGLAVAHGGNASARWASHVLITPSGFALSEVKPNDLVLVRVGPPGTAEPGAGGDPAGEPDRRPSMELPMHLALYESRPEAGAVVHAHPPACTAFAMTEREVKPLPLEASLALGRLPVAPLLPPGSRDLARAVADLGREYRVVLLAGHGLVAVGGTIEEAFHLAELAEEAATVALYTHWLRR